MQNATQGSSSDNLKEKIREESEKSSTPQSSPSRSGTDILDDPRPKFMSDSSESEEEDESEVGPFMLDQELEVDAGSKFLLSGACAEAEAAVDPETQARLEALLEAAGIGRLSAGDGKHLADPEVLRRLTSSVSCALDEAAAALTRMRTDHPRPAPDTRSLVEACSDGDVTTVRKLLTEGKSVHETTEEGESLLSLACSAGYLELAQVLLAMHANVEDRGVKGDCTPLMEAASAGHVDIVALLLNHGAEVNAQSTSGNTALMYACAGGHEDVVKVLLECAASVEDHNENGHTPLMEAASAGHVGVARILLEYGAGINTHSNEFKESALTLACYKGHLDMVRFLLEAGADQEHKTDEMHTALMEASMDGHVEVARLLLDSGAQVNMPTDSFESPLTLAACGGHTELAMLLIERGANIEEVNDEGYTPLMEAAREGHEDMVALLLSQGANINAQTEETQETALTLACCGGFLEVADFLLKAGADLELGASTPLMEAAQEGHLELVRYLLEYYHASVKAITQTGDTALTYACENGHTDVANLLLHYGADLEHESEGGRTPLMKACRAGHTYTVQFLISKNADVNKTTTNNDHTPLSLAAAGGHLGVVEILLANRADPFHRLKDNSTMLIEAAKGGHTNVVHLLLDYPHSIMMQQPAETDAARCTSATDDPQSAAALNKHTVHPQRSLTRKLRTAAISESMLTSAEAQQVRSQPVGEGSIETELSQEMGGLGLEKPELDNSIVAPVPVLTPNAPAPAPPSTPLTAIDISVQYGTPQPFEVSQNTAISDRPKAKAFSKKDGKALRKMISQQQQQQLQMQLPPLEPSQGLQGFLQGHIAAPALPGQQPPQPINPQPGHQPPTEGVVQDSRGNLFHVQQLDPTSPAKLQLHQQLWMLQQQVVPPGDEPDPLLIAAVTDGGGVKAREAADQIDNLVMDFAHKLEAFNIDDVTDVGEQERLILRARQQLVNEETLAAEEEALNLLSQQQAAQDLAYITVPTVASQPNQRADQGLHLQYQYAQQLVGQTVDVTGVGLQIATSPLQLSGANGQPITVTRTNEGTQMMMSGITPPKKFNLPQDCYAAYAKGYQVGVAHQLSNAAAILPAGPVPVLTDSTTCCPCPPAPTQTEMPSTRPASTCTQVQVATQTTSDKKGQITCQGKSKKYRFPQPRQHAAVCPAPPCQPDPGLAGAFPPGQCAAAPQQPLQLSACMDVDSETDSNHDTALTLACAGGHEELVELLLSRGADIEHRDKKGFTPLILAATAGHEKVVEILLNHGADIEAQSERTKDTPLSLACSGGRYEVVELLLNKMANKEHRNVSDYTPLSLAASGGYVNIIKLLLNHGAEINSRTGSKLGISPLMLASMNGHVAAVKLLLDMGSDINAQIETNRNTALTLACFQGRHEVVSLLLDRKANVEHRAKTGLTPLMEAASGGYVEVGRVLLDKGADVNASPVPSSRDTALTIAADKGHVRFVELLLSRNAMVEVKNKKGNSPLWLAANSGHLAVVELLASLDADIDSQDNRKVSCLMAAFRRGHVKVVKWMVNHVSQFPSDQEMTRFIATVSDKELLDKCHECVKIIRAAKDLQSARANKNATILLEEIDLEKTREESKKAAAARRRERKKKKKLEKKEERRKLFEESKRSERNESEDEEEEEENEGDGEVEPEPEETRTNEEQKAERLGSTSPVAVDKEEGDSGIDANSQGSCSSNDVKPKDNSSKRKEKKKKKGADKPMESSTPKPAPPDPKERTNERRTMEADTSFEEPKVHNNSRRQQKSATGYEATRHPADRDDFEATGNETYVPANKGRKSNSNYQNHHEEGSTGKVVVNTSPKGGGKREEGWKEVVRNFPYRSKKVSVPLNAISRVIGRGGSNINAIRAATGAHIEVEKQGKGQGERTITIKGSADATKQAHNLITVLIKEPEVDILQMLPKTNKSSTPMVTTWENKPAVSSANKSKAAPVSGKTVSAGTSTTPLLSLGLIPKPGSGNTGVVNSSSAASRTPISMKLTLTQPQLKPAPSRLLSVADMKRTSAGATKTTMSYTSAIMTAGRGTKVNTSGVPSGAVGPSVPIGVKPRRMVLAPPQTPATAPVSPQVSPPQPVPPSPKHHRPPPTASAPPNMQGQFPGKSPAYPSPSSSSTPSSGGAAPQQDTITRPIPQSEYSLFNDGFSKASMWGREQEANKLNFASVAATGGPASGNKFLDEMPAQVDVTKAPGYRGNTMCSPVGSKNLSYCQPDIPSSQSSRVNVEPTVCPPIGMMPPMPLTDPTASVSQGPIGPQALFGSRAGYHGEPAMYANEIPYNEPITSRLNPRAPDFSYQGKQGMQRPARWSYGIAPEVIYQAQNVSELLTFDNGIAPSPTMSPSSPIQPGLAPVDMKVEDRKMPRPIGTERNWKNTTAINGFDMDPAWIEAKSWQTGSYRPTNAHNATYRFVQDDFGLMDGYGAGAMTEPQFPNGATLQQLMMPPPHIPIQMSNLDPSKMDPNNWDVTDKHGWMTAKWSH